MSKHDEARRAFLKGAAVGAGAIAGTGLVPEALAKAQEKKHQTAAAEPAGPPPMTATSITSPRCWPCR